MLQFYEVTGTTAQRSLICQAQCWVDVARPSNDELLQLREQFGIPKTFLRDALDPDERPRYVRSGEHLMFVVQASHDLGSVSAAEACGVKLTPRRTLALRALSITLAQRTDLQASFGTTRHPKLGSLIEWASAASDSDASKLLPFWPELQVIAAVCRKGFD